MIGGSGTGAGGGGGTGSGAGGRTLMIGADEATTGSTGAGEGAAEIGAGVIGAGVIAAADWEIISTDPSSNPMSASDASDSMAVIGGS